MLENILQNVVKDLYFYYTAKRETIKKNKIENASEFLNHTKWQCQWEVLMDECGITGVEMCCIVC